MFTGIVGEVGQVITIQPDKLAVAASQILKNLELGGSVAVNGACLTVTSFSEKAFSVDLSPETIRRTNLGFLKTGARVNLERPLAMGGELGGHLVQGHVDNTGRIESITPEGGSTLFRFNAPPEIMRFVVEKGFIAIDGISLTVTSVGTGYFQVSIVDYTKHHTNLIYRQIGDPVNLEIDILAKYVENFLAARSPKLTQEYLKEQGF